jgi:hypothetical protein
MWAAGAFRRSLLAQSTGSLRCTTCPRVEVERTLSGVGPNDAGDPIQTSRRPTLWLCGFDTSSGKIGAIVLRLPTFVRLLNRRGAQACRRYRFNRRSIDVAVLQIRVPSPRIIEPCSSRRTSWSPCERPLIGRRNRKLAATQTIGSQTASLDPINRQENRCRQDRLGR